MTPPSVHNVGGDCDRDPFRLWRSHFRGGGYLHKVSPFSQQVKEEKITDLPKCLLILLFRDWRTLQMVAYLPLLSLIGLWWKKLILFHKYLIFLNYRFYSCKKEINVRK